MSELAQLKDEGRIEVLRENRDHYHVFAFVDGVRPREEFISNALGEVRPEKTVDAGKNKTAKSTEAGTAIVSKSHKRQRSREAHHAQKNSSAEKNKVQRSTHARRKR